MTKSVSLKLSDAPGYWLVDLERGVVSRTGEAASPAVSGGGRFDGIELAVVADLREDAFSAKFDK